MKKSFILIALLVNVFVYGQYDYFQWSKTSNITPLVGSTISPGSGLTIDEYNRCLYISSGSNCRLTWMYGDLLTSAPSARSNSNIVEVTDGYGDHFFYIRYDNKIAMTEYLYANGNYTINNNYVIPDNVSSSNPIATNSTSQVYYVRASDNKLCNYWKNTGGSGYGPVLSTAPSVAAGSNIVINGNNIFYVSSTRQICCLTWNTSTGTWSVTTLPGIPPSGAIAVNSKIQVTGSLQSLIVFYVSATDNRIDLYYNSTVNSYGYGPVVANAVPAASGTDIVIYSPAYLTECRYVGTDGNVQSLFGNGCNWTSYTLNSTCAISSSTPALAMGTNNNLFYYSSNDIYTLTNQSQNSGFVYKQGNKLMLNGAPFTTVGINYEARILSTDNGATFFVGPDGMYNYNYSIPICTGSSNCPTLFQSQLKDVASLGFTSIRFNDLQVITNPNDYTDPNLYINYSNPVGGTTMLQLNQTLINQLLTFYDGVVSDVAAAGLKLKFFIGADHIQNNTNCLPAYINYLGQFATHFKNNKTIYVYAMMEEPDLNPSISSTATSAYRGKGDICQHVKDCYNAIRTNDPNHLVTIALACGSQSELSFDPQLLDVDMISFHTYPDNNNLSDATYEEVRESIQWAYNIMQPINKPWMIGESGYPGNNETPTIQQTGTYAQQQAYAKFILSETFSSGASAMGWWQYHDVFWVDSPCCADPALAAEYSNTTQTWDNSANYEGVRDHNNNLKPVASAFLGYQPTVGCSPLYAAANYYNSVSGATNIYTGKVTNASGIALPNSIVMGWNSTYSEAASTLTKPDGTFSLQASYPVVDMYASGLGYVTSASIWSPLSSGNNIVLGAVVCGYGDKTVFNSTINNNVGSENDFHLFPNPNSGSFTVVSNSIVNGSELFLYNMLGEEIFRTDLTASKQDINVGRQPAGMYFYRAIDQNGNIISSGKLVIE